MAIQLFNKMSVRTDFLEDLDGVLNDIIRTLRTNNPNNKYFDFYRVPVNPQKKLFIIGSGSSINNLSNNHWEEISKETSFGFNFFLSHNFNCNYYFLEFSENSAVQTQYYNILSRNNEKIHIPLIVNQKHFTENVLPPPPHINEKFYFQNPFRFPTKNIKLIRFILKFGQLGLPIDNPNYGIHHSSSLCYLVNLGVRIGFKHIILVGVDLNNTEYFFYSKKDDISIKLTEIYKKILSRNNIHRTADSSITGSYKSLSTPDYLNLYNKYVCKRKKVRLEVANPNSLLADFLPVYKFKY